MLLCTIVFINLETKSPEPISSVSDLASDDSREKLHHQLCNTLKLGCVEDEGSTCFRASCQVEIKVDFR
jgi:hypothetical protein